MGGERERAEEGGRRVAEGTYFVHVLLKAYAMLIQCAFMQLVCITHTWISFNSIKLAFLHSPLSLSISCRTPRFLDRLTKSYNFVVVLRLCMHATA